MKTIALTSTMGVHPMARIGPRRMIVSGLVMTTALALWSLYLRPLTALPTAYRKGSEMYYLSWVEHGAFGQQGAAARALLDLPEKRQYERTRALYRRRWWGPIRWMLLLRLFEMAPTQHEREVAKLMQSDSQDDLAGEGWVKT